MINLEMIVAFTVDGGIGLNGDIPWHVPEDLERFKRITTNNTCIMGRKTWESLPDSVRPLPNRRNVVLTSDRDYVAEGAFTYPDLITALKWDTMLGVPIIIGGGQIYNDTIHLVDKIYGTIINQSINCDTFFPLHYLKDKFDVTQMDDSNPDFTFLTYTRKSLPFV